MNDARAIRATFSDWRTVKSRKALQLVFEVPLEQQEEVLRMLGAPMPDQEKWCAIAMIDPDAPTLAMVDAAKLHKSMVVKQRYQQMPEWQKAATRSVMMCQDKKFRDWIRDIHVEGWHAAVLDSHPSTSAENVAALWMRRFCQIESRKDIATEKAAYDRFIALETQYRQATGQMAESRS